MGMGRSLPVADRRGGRWVRLARRPVGGPVHSAWFTELRRHDVKVVVDYDECASNAVCMGIAPEVFEVRDDGFLYVLNENPGPELYDRVRQAANGCPTGAITIVEDE
jgi:ferredoxin